MSLNSIFGVLFATHILSPCMKTMRLNTFHPRDLIDTVPAEFVFQPQSQLGFDTIMCLLSADCCVASDPQSCPPQLLGFQCLFRFHTQISPCISIPTFSQKDGGMQAVFRFSLFLSPIDERARVACRTINIESNRKQNLLDHSIWGQEISRSQETKVHSKQTLKCSSVTELTCDFTGMYIYIYIFQLPLHYIQLICPLKVLVTFFCVCDFPISLSIPMT